jgi:hypothetical protein
MIGMFEYEFDYLNINLTVFYRLSLKNLKKSKKLKSVPIHL